MFTSKNYKDLLESAKAGDESEDDEVLWRLARACRFLSIDASLSLAERKEFAERALRYASRAVEVNADNWAAQKWLGIAV